MWRHEHRHYNVRAFGSDATAVFVAFLAVVSGVMGLCVWLLGDYLAMEMMVGIAFVIGLIVAGVYGVRMARRNEIVGLEQARERQKNKEVETQKQIDAMQRKNSRVPKVKQ